ncbi:MAG: hypothetical protein ACREA0_26675 [bacterium]
MNRTARILAVVLTVVLVGVGIYVAYQNGYETGALTAAAAGADDGGSTTVDRGWGHRGGPGWGYGGFGFFPFFWILPLLFFFLIFSAFRRRGPWGGGDWGPRHEYIEGRFRDMHDRAHKDEGQAPPA